MSHSELAKELAGRITPAEKIKPFVGQNADLLGDFVEAQVRQFVRDVVKPLRVSHGAVIGQPTTNAHQMAKQVDTIIWQANPLPPVFEAGDFALVPWADSMGVLEIKSSAYAGVGSDIDRFLRMEYDLTCGRLYPEKRGIPSILGVIALSTGSIHDPILRDLISDQKAVVLMHYEDGKYQPSDQAMLTLANYLAGVRQRARILQLRIDPKTGRSYIDNSSTSI